MLPALCSMALLLQPEPLQQIVGLSANPTGGNLDMLLVTCSAPWPHGPDPVTAACQQQPQCRVIDLRQPLHDGEDPVEVSCNQAQKKLKTSGIEQWL